MEKMLDRVCPIGLMAFIVFVSFAYGPPPSLPVWAAWALVLLGGFTAGYTAAVAWGARTK